MFNISEETDQGLSVLNIDLGMATTKKTVYVIYYSMYGHVQALAREICKGLEKAGGF